MLQRILLAAAAIICFSSIVHAQQAALPSPDDRARQWLTLLDNGNYAQAYHDAAPSFRNKSNAEAWGSHAAADRAPLGAMASRDLDSVKLSAGGSTAVVRYVTSFANRARASETVTLEDTKPGGWNVASYALN